MIGIEGTSHTSDPASIVADASSGASKHSIAEHAAQRLFDGENPYNVSFETERQLRDKYALMLEASPEKGELLIDRTLRRSFFAARGHAADVHLIEYLNNCIVEGRSPTEDNWPTDPDFYYSTTVRRYHGSADRFMRTIVGLGDLASDQAQPRLGERFMDAFHTAYRRYYTSLQAYKEAYPHEDVPEVDPNPEENWRLGRRGNGNNVAGVQIAHALAYYRQNPDASADDLWRSSLTSSTVLSTAARIRRNKFSRLGLKNIVPEFDAWETEGAPGFLRHPSLFAYTDSGLAVPVHHSFSEKNDNNCSANLDIEHTDPYEIKFNEAGLQMTIGSFAARTTIFPALVQIMQKS